ncbi:lipopolysaccharide transport periplasmic protein LptA [Halothiobacillus sp. DCM-1]|uniref:lipopolysaccharide transport periplasmic protein LptA n=1 Tax=Halothiobacillus sp. DCM-1 TaxID=3112558 RepID=UPI003250E12E
MIRPRILFSALVFSSLCALPTGSFAAKADRQQPIDVTANAKVTDYKNGTSTYTGHVVITQGSLKATGDEAVVYIKDGQLTRAVLSGNPATFQELDDKGQLVKGHANNANYLATQQTVILTGDAELERAGDTLASPLITYDMAAEVVKAGGKQGGERVHVVIQPRKTGADAKDNAPEKPTTKPAP